MRRTPEWFDLDINIGQVAGGQGFRNLTANMQDDEKKGMTLVRTIVDLDLHATSVSSGGRLALGIVIAEDDAIAAGSFPEAQDNIGKPGWVWKALKTFGTSDINDRSQRTIIHEDLKSRRKFQASGYDLVLIVNNFEGVTAVNIDGLIRTLWLKS